MDKKKKAFYITELVLLLAAGFFTFAMVGYKTMALVLVGIAIIVALYYLISVKCKEHRELRKRLRFALSFFILLGMMAFAVLEAPIISEAATDEDVSADYAIVLGAGVNGYEPSLSLKNRLDAALDYAQKYPEAKLIVSGGQGPGEKITEAECMRLWLEERGVEPQRIITEDKARSTEENLLFSQELIRKDGGDPYGKTAIITAEYHLHRAKLMAQEIDLDPVGVAAHTSKAILMVNYFIREAAALAAYIML